MSYETWVIIAVVLGSGLILSVGGLIAYAIMSRDTRDWRAEARIRQFENARYWKKMHDENTRFFLSMGLTVQQIFERIDAGRFDEPESDNLRY